MSRRGALLVPLVLAIPAPSSAAEPPGKAPPPVVAPALSSFGDAELPAPPGPRLPRPPSPPMALEMPRAAVPDAEQDRGPGFGGSVALVVVGGSLLVGAVSMIGAGAGEHSKCLRPEPWESDSWDWSTCVGLDALVVGSILAIPATAMIIPGGFWLATSLREPRPRAPDLSVGPGGLRLRF